MAIAAFVHGSHQSVPHLVCREVELIRVDDMIAFRERGGFRSPYEFERLFETEAEAGVWAVAQIEDFATRVLAEASRLDGIPRSIARLPVTQAAVAATEEAAV